MDSLSVDAPPHIYYTVSELNLVKDVTMLRNASVKTIGYFKGDHLQGINFEAPKEITDAEDEIRLDLTHQEIDFGSNKPYLITGLLFTTNYMPVLLVKVVKELDLGFDDLGKYHVLLMTVRKRCPHFQDLIDVAKENNWI